MKPDRGSFIEFYFTEFYFTEFYRQHGDRIYRHGQGEEPLLIGI